MNISEVIDNLQYVKDCLADERGSDFSGVEALIIAIRIIKMEPVKAEMYFKRKEIEKMITLNTTIEGATYLSIIHRLYNWLNDMRFAIAPDETVTDPKDRSDRLIQIDLIDEIMTWIEDTLKEENYVSTGTL